MFGERAVDEAHKDIRIGAVTPAPGSEKAGGVAGRADHPTGVNFSDVPPAGGTTDQYSPIVSELPRVLSAL